jgi:hypothetical protein
VQLERGGNLALKSPGKKEHLLDDAVLLAKCGHELVGIVGDGGIVDRLEQILADPFDSSAQ